MLQKFQVLLQLRDIMSLDCIVTGSQQFEQPTACLCQTLDTLQPTNNI